MESRALVVPSCTRAYTLICLCITILRDSNRPILLRIRGSTPIEQTWEIDQVEVTPCVSSVSLSEWHSSYDLNGQQIVNPTFALLLEHFTIGH